MMKSDYTSTMETRDGVKLLVRKLSGTDVAALQAFNDALSTETRNKFLPHHYDDSTVADVLARSETDEDFVLGAFDGDRIVGYFFLRRIHGKVPLLGIGMIDEFQHRGLGRQMMRILIDQAEAEGCEGIRLTTVKTNDNAFALYQKCGFKYYDDVEHVMADRGIIVERAMFYAIKEGAKPVEDR